MGFLDGPAKDRCYDYIVVGAGSAGAHLARRLVEGSEARVLLIEAGGSAKRNGKAGILSQVPAYYPRLFGSAADWGFRTAPQANLAGRQLVFPRGKAIGGSGAINALIHVAAASADYRRWGWEEPRAPVTDNNQPGIQCAATGIDLAPIQSPHPWTGTFLEAAQSAGFSTNNLLHRSSPGSAGLFLLTQKFGRRQHSGLKLSDVCDERDVAPPNDTASSRLDVLTGWEAERLELGQTPSVVLRNTSGDTTSIVSGRKIILTAGAIGSPSILLRSGIGSAEKVVGDERPVLEMPAVGENLQDHLVYPVIFKAKNVDGLPLRFSREHRDEFRQRGSGPMASNIAEAGAFFSLDKNSDAPEFQLHFTPTHYLKYPLDGAPDCFSIAVTPLHPQSRGSVSLSAIDPNYLSVESDRTDLEAAVEWTQGAFGAAMESIAESELLPGRRGNRPGGLKRSIAAFSRSIYHPTSTCRMGLSPSNSVVNSDFALHGCEEVLIADASVFPDLPSGNTQAPTFWIAERCAEKLLRRAADSNCG